MRNFSVAFFLLLGIISFSTGFAVLFVSAFAADKYDVTRIILAFTLSVICFCVVNIIYRR